MKFWMFLLAIAAVASAVYSPDDDAKKITSYYSTRVSGGHLKNKEWVENVVKTTNFYALKFGVNVEGQVLLSSFITESNLDPDALNKKEGSRGLTQISPSSLPFLYKKLSASVPEKLPRRSEILKYPDYQIALGVLAFKFKLRDAKGDTWEAVRRYNGGGQASYQYQAKVRQVYQSVFKGIGHVGHSATRPILVSKGEKMFKKTLLALALLWAPGVHMQAAEVPEAQVVMPSEKVSAPSVEILRDFEFKQYPCYGCPGDKSMTDGIPAKVKAQLAIYTAARDAYKKTWNEADVQKASDYAFRSDVAAWPWVNLANHIWEVNGNPDDADKALDKAEALIKGHKAAGVRAMIDSNRKGIAELRKTLAKAKEDAEE